ncbi:Cyclin [Lachnellula occidentalis]|uniref:RNA polymerase II holoenzyme cyclin-like subunit n=1 Tax=Lachnellula occidentalis TaxID=215460 RepID=A0A8H8UF61_9HELO|nr:Cyclin [Lachnellula occidentalis]
MAPSSVSEDERYRTSTQYRLWSFTPASLLELRTTTNRNAANRVREAVWRVREARAAASSGNTSEADGGNSRAVSAVPEGEVDCLSVEEELKLVTHFCRQTLQLGDHLQVPTDVKNWTLEQKLMALQATAVQYIKRFYITNSCMTYDPKTLLKTALFFATKTENHYFRLTKFAEAITATKPEEILASEFLLTQGLRFTFDVRHPFRALEGAVMELQAMANGQIPGGDKLRGMGRRVKEAHGKAREYLKTSALLTDVYFHYTPSQIMMASLLIADRQLISLYLGSKLPPGSANATISAKLMEALDKCAEMLQSLDEQSTADKKELGALAKKLRKCRNPEKIDLVSIQRAKREGDEEVDEKVVKKRKLEREQSAKEGEDLFGPTIKK